MFDYLNGKLVDKRRTVKGTFFTLDVNGVGYLLEVSERDFIQTEENNASVKCFVYLIHREDVMSLYGFLNKETRDIFQTLLSVSGVGAKMALALLNEFDLYNLISLVIDGNFKELTRAKGVGPKLAQKIILELKDKLIKTDLPDVKNSNVFENQTVEDVQAIMLSLGYNENEIKGALSTVLETISDKSNSEEILRKAITVLSM